MTIIIRDNVIHTKHTAYKFEMPHTGPFLITQYFTNVTVKLQMTYNIRCIKPYKYDTKVEDYSSKNMFDDVNI